MSGIWNLKTFPREMENLINLRHVYFDEDVEVPFGMTRLTHLQTLSSFNLDEDGRHRLDELGGLNELKGKLVIGALEYVRDKEEAMKSNLVEKAYLQKLILKWGEERNGKFLDEDILEGLQPHPNLKSLMIKEFNGTKFASWMMRNWLSLETVKIKDCGNLESFQISPSQSLQELKIVGCPKLRCTSIHSLPSLRDLVIKRCTTLEGDLSLNCCTSLRILKIKDCNGFTSILSGLYSCTSLRKVFIEDCPNLRTLSGHGLQTPVSLEKMEIWNCPNLEAIPSLDNLTSLTNLEIRRCVGLISLPSGLAYCTSLTKLDIEGCDGLISLPSGLAYCTSLSTLSLSDCWKLQYLPKGLQAPVSLEKMEIRNCPNLEAIPSLDNLTSLTNLYIERCDGLISLPSGLAYCTSLTHLDVDSCSNLEAIPSLNNLTALTNLEIRRCDGLISLPSGLAYCTSLTRLYVSYCSNLISLSDHNVSCLHSLSRLEDLSIGAFCQELDSFPDFQVPSKVLRLYGWPKLKSLPQQIQHSASLTSLAISSFDGLEALPEWLGNLTSLTFLGIWFCENLMYLPTVEAMQRLTKLQALWIQSCPRLKERCDKDSGPEWPKISHIPYLSIR